MITRSARVDEALDLRLLACGLVHLTAFPRSRLLAPTSWYRIFAIHSYRIQTLLKDAQTATAPSLACPSLFCA